MSRKKSTLNNRTHLVQCASLHQGYGVSCLVTAIAHADMHLRKLLLRVGDIEANPGVLPPSSKIQSSVPHIPSQHCTNVAHRNCIGALVAINHRPGFVKNVSCSPQQQLLTAKHPPEPLYIIQLHSTYHYSFPTDSAITFT